MKFQIFVFLVANILFPFTAGAISYLSGNVIASSCAIEGLARSEKELKGKQFILVFELSSGNAHIFVSDGVSNNPPQATIAYNHEAEGEFYFEANGGVENNERFLDIFNYLRSIDLKYYSSYTEAFDDAKNNASYCEIKYIFLEKYLSRRME